MIVLVNGQRQATVDVRDRGLQYGDGLFETMAVCAQRPRFLDWHLQRLAEGARRLGLPPLDEAVIRAELAVAARDGAGVLKLIVTRGTGVRGYRPPRDAAPTRIVMAFEAGAAPAPQGARVGWCRTRLGQNPALAGIKHTNRLEQVLARAEWDDGQQDEGLMLDSEGRVIGATSANLFAWLGERWVTPRVDACGIAGVMRRAFREWLRGQGRPVEERVLTVAEVSASAALLLTNARLGAWPVRELAGRPLSPVAESAAFNAWLARQ